jgi:UDP-N-acetyl-D-mannosaminuronate dehydrogenase
MDTSNRAHGQRGKTLVVGLGEVGGALAEVLDRSETVLRIDIAPVEINEPINIMHICIPFKVQADFEAATVEYIKRFKPALTIINSTVMPGTTRSIAEKSGAALAYSPVRGKHVRMQQDMLHYCKFVAAIESDDAARAASHFQAAGMKTRIVNKVETLEVAKLAETTYFGVCIAYAQELNRYCERVGGNYEEAIGFFEEVGFLPLQPYFPGFIGGHCVIPNIKILLELAPSTMLEAILDSNERRGHEIESENRHTNQVSSATHQSAEGKMLADR